VRSTGEPGSLTTRLLISQIAVSIAMALTMVIVAAIAGPSLFEAHMQQAGQANPGVLAHSEEAFRTAGFISLAIGLIIATTGTIVVSVLISRRLRRSLTELGDAATRISEGDYAMRVAAGDSRELATLANSFNTMAGRLATVEGTRRRLLTDLSHEIRTPLASMEICVESLEDGAIEPGPEAWQILASQIDRIARLANDIGQVSAAEEGRLNLVTHPIDPNELAAAAVLAAKDGFERKHVRLDLHPSGDGLSTPVTADAARIGQVLGNLLSNALRHTSAGGNVMLTVTPGDGSVLLAVTDDGAGIAPEHVPHIFERFYRADSARDRDHGGTGVGLAISQAIAKAHGGILSASSQGPGRGTTVTLRLPTLAGQNLTESSH
jgi:signal transduction histidine kinase